MMQFLLLSILGLIVSLCFFLLIYLKVQLHGIRKTLKEKGAIKTRRITLLSLFEIIFWMIPVFLYGEDEEIMRRKTKQINLTWLLMVVASVIAIKIKL